MTVPIQTSNGFAARPKPEKMVTLICKNCRMALYLSEKSLQERTWRCPSCGTVTKSATA
jgi:hypothetical protein